MTTEAPHWDPYDHGLRIDPYGAWRRLRDDADRVLTQGAVRSLEIASNS